MSEAKPKRKFWQFHLSTTVIFVLLLGGLIGANLCDHGLPPPPNFEHARRSQYGWPLDAVEQCYEYEVFCIYPDKVTRWYESNIAIDALVVITLSLATACLWESIIRRREARKT